MELKTSGRVLRSPGKHVPRRAAVYAAATCLLALAGYAPDRSVAAQSSRPVVHVIAIDGVIDLGVAPFLERTIREAEAGGAAAIVLEINTFGGRVDAAVAMRDTLLNSKVRTVAFINQRAISAGALIALACNTIVMVKGGTIGAAAPVTGGAGESRPADEKSVSYVRKEFRATAESRNRPPVFINLNAIHRKKSFSNRLLTGLVAMKTKLLRTLWFARTAKS